MTPDADRICQDCGRNNPADALVCVCGHALSSMSLRETPASKRRLPLWLAVVLGGVLPAAFLLRASFQFGRVVGGMEFDDPLPSTAETNPCVITHSVTQHTSEFWVRHKDPSEDDEATNGPRETASVLRGQVQNNCPEKQKHVRLHFRVTDGKQRLGTATLDVYDIPAGGSKEFERAWMGPITSWDIRVAK